LAEKIQQIPAPTFGEQQRAEFIKQKFVESGINDVVLDGVGNVYARIIGQGTRLPLVVSAHLDTVFPESTNLSLTRAPGKIIGPGIGDNSLGLAALFGLYWIVFEKEQVNNICLPLDGDIWLVANIAEEGLGNLLGMKAVVDRFGKDVRAYIILEGMSLGHIFHRGLGVRRYSISVNTPGGHSWLDFGQPSAIHELAELIDRIRKIEYPTEPRTSYNIGTISGGTSVNTIASNANLQLDLRSVSPSMLDGISNQIEALVRETNQSTGKDIQVVADVIGERPAGEISSDHPLVKIATDCHRGYGIRPKLNIGSTDANEPLNRGYPAICIGLTTGGGAHTAHEYIDIEPVGQGLGVLSDLVQAI
jgi:acetylornithine deacetylase/succinyl-diaminopimelate desuccinylase-like protein